MLLNFEIYMYEKKHVIYQFNFMNFLGQIKNNKSAVHDNFMIVHGDRDLIETRRSYRSITDKIHKHWEPENHDLNQGTFQRGKKPPGVPTVDSWLTFSGSQAEESQGIVDAFAG